MNKHILFEGESIIYWRDSSFNGYAYVIIDSTNFPINLLEGVCGNYCVSIQEYIGYYCPTYFGETSNLAGVFRKFNAQIEAEVEEVLKKMQTDPNVSTSCFHKKLMVRPNPAPESERIQESNTLTQYWINQ